LNSTPKPSASHTARLLAANVYGALYVAYSDGSVYRFEEDEFMAPAEVGEKNRYRTRSGGKNRRRL